MLSNDFNLLIQFKTILKNLPPLSYAQFIKLEVLMKRCLIMNIQQLHNGPILSSLERSLEFIQDKVDLHIFCNRIENFSIFSFIDKFLFLRASKSFKIVISIKTLNCNEKRMLVFQESHLYEIKLYNLDQNSIQQ